MARMPSGYRVEFGASRTEPDGTLIVDVTVTMSRWRIALETAKALARGEVTIRRTRRPRG